MTSDERERAAREWLEKMGLLYWNGKEAVANEVDVTSLIAILTATEAATLDEAARYVQDRTLMDAHLGPLWNAGWTNAAEFFANAFRDQAQERRT